MSLQLLENDLKASYLSKAVDYVWKFGKKIVPKISDPHHRLNLRKEEVVSDQSVIRLHWNLSLLTVDSLFCGVYLNQVSGKQAIDW
jgi:hypothetical protein